MTSLTACPGIQQRWDEYGTSLGIESEDSFHDISSFGLTFVPVVRLSVLFWTETRSCAYGRRDEERRYILDALR